MTPTIFFGALFLGTPVVFVIVALVESFWRKDTNV